jgi:hypothetical protein
MTDIESLKTSLTGLFDKPVVFCYDNGTYKAGLFRDIHSKADFHPSTAYITKLLPPLLQKLQANYSHDHPPALSEDDIRNIGTLSSTLQQATAKAAMAIRPSSGYNHDGARPSLLKATAQALYAEEVLKVFKEVMEFEQGRGTKMGDALQSSISRGLSGAQSLKNNRLDLVTEIVSKKLSVPVKEETRKDPSYPKKTLHIPDAKATPGRDRCRT